MAKKTKKIEHVLIPKHEVLSEKQKEKLLEQYSITIRQLPKISSKDPAIADDGLKQGDVVKITRKSPTAGESYFYRVVIDV